MRRVRVAYTLEQCWHDAPGATAVALAAIAERAKRVCLVVDPWNAIGAGQVFAYANGIAALRT